MTADITSVRVKLRDTTTPHIYTDEEITAALAEAADWIEIRSVPTTCPKHDLLQKLVAARSLASSRGSGREPSGQISQVTEGNRSMTFATDVSTGPVAAWTADIDELVDYCKGRSAGQVRGGMGVLHGNY